MTSLTDMPADIVEAAAEVYAGLHANNYDADCDDRERSEDRLAIAHAILAERQRCAQIVQSVPIVELTSAPPVDVQHEITFEVGAKAQRDAILMNWSALPERGLTANEKAALDAYCERRRQQGGA